jgi:hypothetical protein
MHAPSRTVLGQARFELAPPFWRMAGYFSVGCARVPKMASRRSSGARLRSVGYLGQFIDDLNTLKTFNALLGPVAGLLPV